MVVIATRQPGQRPETIRTRLARFMPTRITSGWSVAWSAAIEHAEEIADEHELQMAEHLGCYGAAVAHALAQAELTAERLRLSADCATADNGLQTITIEVRAEIDGPEVDQEIFDAIVRRAEPACPVLKGLATQATLRLIAIVDTPGSGVGVAGGVAAGSHGAGVPAGGAAAPATGDGEAPFRSDEARADGIAPEGRRPVSTPVAPSESEGAAMATRDIGTGAAVEQHVRQNAARPGLTPGTEVSAGAGAGNSTSAAKVLKPTSAPHGMRPGHGVAGSIRAARTRRSSQSGSAATSTEHGLLELFGGRLTAPTWLTRRMAVLLTVAFAACAVIPAAWSNAA